MINIRLKFNEANITSVSVRIRTAAISSVVAIRSSSFVRRLGLYGHQREKEDGVQHSKPAWVKG
jgi:hypothetical protein